METALISVKNPLVANSVGRCIVIYARLNAVGVNPLYSLNFRLKFEMFLKPERSETSEIERSGFFFSSRQEYSSLISNRNWKKVLFVRCLK